MGKNISVIGIGKLGLCFALNLERKGYSVIGVDLFQDYVNSLNDKSFVSEEEGVTEMLISSSEFFATTSVEEALKNELIFLVVATPSLENGKYDHAQLERVADELLSFGPQKTKKHLVICCTTMPGYSDTLHEKMLSHNYTVSYNPEFIAQGTIVRDQRYPDMVLIGEADEESGDLIEKLYMDMCDNSPRFCRMSRTEAEITKIALNCFLTTKIAYANMVGDVVVKSGYTPEKVLSAIGSDTRIGPKYLRWGYGFGGPCFPRDNRAFGIYSESVGIYPHISYSTDKSNADHLAHYADYLRKDKKQVIFNYVTYKPESTILEESQELKTAELLASLGYEVIINERKSVIEKLKEKYGQKFIYQERVSREDIRLDKALHDS